MGRGPVLCKRHYWAANEWLNGCDTLVVHIESTLVLEYGLCVGQVGLVPGIVNLVCSVLFLITAYLITVAKAYY